MNDQVYVYLDASFYTVFSTDPARLNANFLLYTSYDNYQPVADRTFSLANFYMNFTPTVQPQNYLVGAVVSAVANEVLFI